MPLVTTLEAYFSATLRASKFPRVKALRSHALTTAWFGTVAYQGIRLSQLFVKEALILLIQGCLAEICEYALDLLAAYRLHAAVVEALYLV